MITMMAAVALQTATVNPDATPSAATSLLVLRTLETVCPLYFRNSPLTSEENARIGAAVEVLAGADDELKNVPAGFVIKFRASRNACEMQVLSDGEETPSIPDLLAGLAGSGWQLSEAFIEDDEARWFATRGDARLDGVIFPKFVVSMTPVVPDARPVP